MKCTCNINDSCNTNDSTYILYGLFSLFYGGGVVVEGARGGGVKSVEMFPITLSAPKRP